MRTLKQTIIEMEEKGDLNSTFILNEFKKRYKIAYEKAKDSYREAYIYLMNELKYLNPKKLRGKTIKTEVDDLNDGGDLCEYCGRYGMVGDENDKNYSCWYCKNKRTCK